MSVGYILGHDHHSILSQQVLCISTLWFLSIQYIYSQSQLTKSQHIIFTCCIFLSCIKMGSFQTFLCLFLVTLSYIISLSNAYSFSAGGKDGWILSPSETYDSWSKRQRFIIGDTITFKYTQGVDSVLGVNKNDYDNCNINNPITKKDDGNSVFKLDKSGPFYFISGNKSNCDQGQKLNLVVISPKNHHMASSPVASPPAPAAMTPLSPEIPALPSSPTSMPGSEAPVSTSGVEGPVASASSPSGAPPPTSFAAAKLTPSVAVVASIWFVTSVALGSFVITH